MDSDKIIQLSTRLMELTSAGKIHWNLVNPKPLQEEPEEDEADSGRSPSILEIQRATFVAVSSILQKGAGWERFIYSAQAGGKVFRLNGIVFPNRQDKDRYGRVRMQLWNAEETELEYEFPESITFVHLFQLVHDSAAHEADKFVDQFLQNSEMLETSH